MQRIYLSEQHEALARVIAGERMANNAGRLDDAAIDPLEANILGARHEIAVSLALGADPEVSLDRSPKRDDGFDLEIRGQKVQVRGTMKPYRNLIWKQKDWPPRVTPDVIVLCWQDGAAVVVVGAVASAEFDRLKEDASWMPRRNWLVPWRSMRALADVMVSA